MARLKETPGVASLALQFTILCALRTDETLGMPHNKEIEGDEIDFERAILSIPKERMKMRKMHDVPLSDAALAILKTQHEARGRNAHVFPGGRPRQPLSAMAMAMLLRRMGVKDATVHGFRTSFRTWAGENGVEFETAERCLAHSVGNAASQSGNNRTTLLERRRPIMSAWAAYICSEDKAQTAKVVPISGGRKR